MNCQNKPNVDEQTVARCQIPRPSEYNRYASLASTDSERQRIPEPDPPQGTDGPPDEEEVQGGITGNRSCGCCGAPMEQNLTDGSAVANQYCGICGRQPLCGSCPHGMWWQVGFPMRDFRWERLTAAAAASTTGPRTAATGEVRIGVQCCQCRGQLDQEHEAPEHPLPIIPGRPVGWTTCPHYRSSYSTLEDGAIIRHHSCNNQNREGRNIMQQRKELDNQMGHASPDLVLLQTGDVPSNYFGTRHLWTMSAQQDARVAEGGE